MAIGYGTTITDVLNIWNDIGVFAYVIPFLLIFAVVFAILDKTKMLSGDDGENRGIVGIIAVAIGLLSLQFDFVSEFFAVIFPRFGVGLALFLSIIIFLGFFYPEGSGDKDGWGGKVAWVGWVVGIGVFIWSLSEWDQWSGQVGFGGWFVDNVWSIVIIGILVAVVVVFSGGRRDKGDKRGRRNRRNRRNRDSDDD